MTPSLYVCAGPSDEPADGVYWSVAKLNEDTTNGIMSIHFHIIFLDDQPPTHCPLTPLTSISRIHDVELPEDPTSTIHSLLGEFTNPIRGFGIGSPSEF